MLVRLILLALLCISNSSTWGQVFIQETHTVDHVSKSDFETNLEQYIPNDLKEYTLVVQKYRCMEIFEMHRKANLLSLYQKGVDTIKVSPPYPDWEEYDEVKLCKKMLRFEENKIKLLEKGYPHPFNVVVKSGIRDLNPEKFRYVLKRRIYSTMNHPKLQYSATHLHYIYDRELATNFAISNHHDILDWIIKTASAK